LGSTSYIVNDSAQITQKLAYMPFGEDFVDLNYNTPYPPLTPFRFNGKEKDEETGFNYFGARYYYPDWGWISVDPLAHKYPHLSPYVYCANNPLKYIDPNGMYPKSILKFNSNLGLYGGYKFTKSATHLLSLVTGVSKNYIENTTVQERAVGQYRPFYKANKGGGAITMGRSSWNANITFTENWFDDNKNSYDGHGYGQDVIGWLELAAHEIGHIPQIDKGGGLLGYLATFAKEYMQNSHDNAPSEKEADRGREEFINFNDFVDKNYGNGAMKKLFKSKVSEDDKIKKIDNWWNHYKNSQKSSNGYE
jgi:RHS repeat-associated protein